jgi:hypothetical protein
MKKNTQCGAAAAAFEKADAAPGARTPPCGGAAGNARGGIRLGCTRAAPAARRSFDRHVADPLGGVNGKESDFDRSHVGNKNAAEADAAEAGDCRKHLAGAYQNKKDIIQGWTFQEFPRL